VFGKNWDIKKTTIFVAVQFAENEFF